MSDTPLILFVTSEIYPFSKTGGLADVMGALPLTLHRRGYNVAVITPFYGRVSTGGYPIHLVQSDVPVGYPYGPTTCDVYRADFCDMPVYFIDRPECFDRRFYYNTHKGDYFDNCERFVFFSRAALEWTKHLDTPPAVINANDWQTGLIPAFVHFWKRSDPFWSGVKTVMTIHNLAFQGRFAFRLFHNCGLPWEAWNMDGVEYYGDFCLLKAGISYSDLITTVSPGYAEEIRTPVFGCGMEGILDKRSTRLKGILNGADYEVWNPGNDKFLPVGYSAENMKGKQACKEFLLKEMNLDESLKDRPLLGFIGRIRRQKGVDLLIDIIPELMKDDVGLVVLGEGNLEFEAKLQSLMEEYPGRLAVRIGYTEELAHIIQAGTNIFLMPSRYEPCGLTQMYSLRYGAVPVATAVGGLKDTIVPYPDPNATGFTFEAAEPLPFLKSVREAVRAWEQPEIWRPLKKRAMEVNFSWDDSAEKYIDAFREIGAGV